MTPRRGSWRAGLVAGVVGVLAVGCGKEPTRVGQAPPPPTQQDPGLTTPTAPLPDPPVVPDPTVDPAVPPPGVFTPFPAPMRPGGFVEPTSPTFKPPEPTPAPPTFPGNPPVPPVVPPPTPPVPDPTKPADPPPAQPPTTPETPKPTDPPKPPEYPKEVGGKDLKAWLKELEYTAGGPIQKDDQTREAAVRAIPAFGPSSRKPSVTPLINAITADPDPGVQVAAITVISSMGFDMREQVKPVITVLRSKMNQVGNGNIVKMYCVRSLASFGTDAVAAVPELRNASGDKSWETRKEVAIALSMVGATPTDEKGKPLKKDGKDIGPNMIAIDTLMNFQLRDPCVSVRMEAVKSLLALGPPAAATPAEYIEKTEKIQKTIAEVVQFETGKGAKVNGKFASPDRGVAVWVLLVQLMYDDRLAPENVKTIANYVTEPDGPNADMLRLYALQVLGAAGKLSAPAVPKIIDALSYTHEPVLMLTAMNALALIGDAADSAVPALKKLADQPPKPLPPDAPKWARPDDTIQRMAKQTIEVISGKRKMEDYGKEDPPPMKAAPPPPPPDKK